MKLYKLGRNVHRSKILDGCNFRKGKDLSFCRDDDSLLIAHQMWSSTQTSVIRRLRLGCERINDVEVKVTAYDHEFDSVPIVLVVEDVEETAISYPWRYFLFSELAV